MTAPRTSTPWQFIVEKHETKSGWLADSTSIHTTWDHGQLKGPAPVVCLGYSVGKDGRQIVSLVIHPDDAAFIVHACNSHAALVAFVEKYIREDEEAIAEWERQFPKIKWGKDDRAIKNLEAARELLKAAK